MVLRPGERLEGVCLNAKCGSNAQEALVDWEAEERRREAERRRAALDELRRITVERTLLAPEGEEIGFATPGFLETLESLLVPEWDAETMKHILLGWQGAMRAWLAGELGSSDGTAEEVTSVFRDRYGVLALEPKGDEIRTALGELREEVVCSERGLKRWVACLAFVRSWRDGVQTGDAVTQAMHRVTGMGVA